MTDETNPFANENDGATPSPNDIPGFTEVTGPAAFKAQQKAAQEAAQATEQAQVAAQQNELSAKVTQLEASLAQGHEQMMRLAADMENLRKRAQREREDASKYAVSSFARDLLDVADTFGRALQSIPEDLRGDERISPLVTGIEATSRALMNCFEKYGIKKLEPMDEPFNPNFHEVMFEAPVPGKQGGIIIQLIEAGYMLHDRLLRPARVGVSKADPTAGAHHNVDTQA